MKQLTILFLLSISLTAFAGDKVDKSINVDSAGVVEVHNTRGEISILGWDKNVVSVKGTLDDLAESFVFEKQEDTVVVKVKLPRNTNFKSRDGSNLVIKVPVASKVSFSGVATDLKVNTIHNGIEINSVSGDLEIKDIKKRTYINNVSGDINLSQIEGALEVSTVSGDLKGVVSSPKIVVSGVSAEIEINANQIEFANVSNVSGDLSLRGKLSDDGELKMSSVSGEAFYYVNGELDATVKVDTAPGGNIINQVTSDKPKTSFIQSQSLKFKSGNGNAAIRMSTVSGDIGIKRKK